MSLSVSPAIEVDCRLPPVMTGTLLAACLLASLVPWLLSGDGWGALATVTAAGLTAFLYWRVRWLRRGAGLRILWASDGNWWLAEGRGEAMQARLRRDSRVFPHGLWLRWDSPAGPRQAILLRRGAQAEMVRRLAVRLRLQGLALPEDSHAQAR